MARIGDEAPLPREPGVEPLEHLVERFAEPVDLVMGTWEREALVRVLRRDSCCAPAHVVDRPQRGSGYEVADARREEHGEWEDEKQLREEAVNRAIAILE